MRLWRRRIWGAIALASLLALVMWGALAWRASSHRLTAHYCREFAAKYGSSESLGDVNYASFTSCYGEPWDGYARRAAEDMRARSGDRAYRGAKAEYYRDLGRRYDEVAERPWRTGPPAPY